MTQKLITILALLALAACSGGGGGGGGSLPGRIIPPSGTPTPPSTGGTIKHIIIIVQENRTVDNLFQSLPGANTQSWGMDGTARVALSPVDLSARWDVAHTHASWMAACHMSGRACQMDGWNGEPCGHGYCPANAPFSYVPQGQVQPYYDLAEQYTFADETLQDNQGPSFPAHQYLLSGTSAVTSDAWPKIAENSKRAGCDAPLSAVSQLINQDGEESGTAYPCRHTSSILENLDAAGLSWRYYQASCGTGLWHGPDAIFDIWSNKAKMRSNVVCKPAQFLTDIQQGDLASVTYITPTSKSSDHAYQNDGSGPDWVASVVNAVGKSPYWGSTAIVLTWDDWGGFYDHVSPPIANAYEPGFRVPLLCIGPFAKPHFIDHTPHGFGSILHFVENTFNLPGMGTTDGTQDALGSCWSFAQHPRQFRPIPLKNKGHGAAYFRAQDANTSPDDD
jgi:phospholipase C